MSIPRFQAEESGSILVEAAMTLPILVVLFVGMVEFTEAYATKGRVANVAATMANLVAQPTTMDTSTLADIVTASKTIMNPYSASPLKVEITNIKVRPDGSPVVDWSTVKAEGSRIQLPSGLAGPGECVVMVKSTYSYKPVLAMFLKDIIVFKSENYTKPRRITCQNSDSYIQQPQ
jgi:Flp pilus assembly protein TadG